MLGQHLIYVLTFGEKCQAGEWKVNYDRPFMDYSGRKKDNVLLKKCQDGKS